MTEREAWLDLARDFSKRRSLRPWRCQNGLCRALAYSFLGGDIYFSMRDKVFNAVQTARTIKQWEAYMAPVTESGDKIRVRFCRRMARALAPKKRRRA